MRARQSVTVQLQSEQMKTPLAITLVFMGALLVMTPAISDFFYQRNVIALMSSQTGVSSVVLQGQMSQIYRFGCWLTGSGMVGIAVLCSMAVLRRGARNAELAVQGA